jgi:hypothetical protein
MPNGTFQSGASDDPTASHDYFHWTELSKLTPEDLLAARPASAGLPKRKFAAQWTLPPPED